MLHPEHPDAESERDVLETVAAVDADLRAAGYSVAHLGVGDNPRDLLDGLQKQRPDVVFNLFEGLADNVSTETCVAGLLDWQGIPYTGSSFETLCLARHKHRSKYLLQGAGLATPGFFVVDDSNVVPPIASWPVMVKPTGQDASVGIDQDSVVTDMAQVEARVRLMLARHGAPVLVEEFIDGREFNVALIEAPELRTLPASEIVFRCDDDNPWPIVSYDSKWQPGSKADLAAQAKYPADISADLAEQLSRMARTAFVLLGCRDYARVDFRCSESGKPYILEVNPNPDFNPTAGLTKALATVGMSHGDLSVRLISNALNRKEPHTK